MGPNLVVYPGEKVYNGVTEAQIETIFQRATTK
ncbi:MAG: (2Fe-2S) ferredoxin domain-containing protein [Anaerolineae bacterium]|nr:(2Fe-2S) ferredoxin domain-containing protein [Anaerolineae bacterium]